MPRRPMLDTDVVIDYLRQRPDAVAFVKGLQDRPIISVVTVGELYSGVREGEERVFLDALAVAFRVVPVTRSIAVQAGLYRRQYRKSHGVELADALIAATAEAMGAKLHTLNVKHYPMLAHVTVPYRKTERQTPRAQDNSDKLGQ